MQFQVLGPVTACNERGPVELGPARQRTVLAVLLVEPGVVVSVDQLVDRVWGVAAPQRARPTLYTYLSRLRRVLETAGGPVLARRAGGYTLEIDAAAVDLHRFRALVAQARQSADDNRAAARWQEAMGLWQARPFADLDSDWLHTVALGIEAERFAAMLDYADVLLRGGEHERLLPDLLAAAREYPLDERLAGLLMLGLYRCGRPADALAHYRLLRDRLVDELGSDPGRALQELHHRILRQDAALASNSTTIIAPASPPAQLPADPAGFIGRSRDLSRLDDLLAEAGGDASPARAARTVVIAISGTAGVGKTALAVHWARRVAGQFPDGQVYLDLRGFDPGGTARSPSEALRALLELLGVAPEKLPTSMDALAGWLRSRLAGTRTLLLLDNARDTEQVLPLLPGAPGCLTVVTGRRQLAGLAAQTGARLLRLDPFPVEEARSLLAYRLGDQRIADEPAATEDIIAACARLPLALAITAARVAAQPEFPLKVFADRLTDAASRFDALDTGDRGSSVRAAFACSYHALTPACAQLFRLLGLAPGPDLAVATAASLAGEPVARVRGLLAELTRAHLVAEHRPGRYTLHDLLRAYAAELLHTHDAAADRQAATHRVLDHYLHTAYAADRLLNPVRVRWPFEPAHSGVTVDSLADYPQALAWFGAEQAALLGAVRLATEAGFDTQVWQLAWALATFLYRRGHWNDLATAQLAALQAAERLGDQRKQAVADYNVAQAQERLGRDEEALARLRHVLDLRTQLGDHEYLGHTHLAIGAFLSRRERYREALHHAEQALDLFRDAGDRSGQANALNNIAVARTALGDHAAAISLCRQAMSVHEELGDQIQTGVAWDSLGMAYQHAGDPHQAEACYRQAIARFGDFGDSYLEADTRIRLGDVQAAAGDPAGARDTWHRALAVLVELRHPDADQVRAKLDQPESAATPSIRAGRS